MTNSKKRNNECGPVIACGAATVSFSHEPGDPTSIDNLIAAIKRFVKEDRSVTTERSPRTEQKPATARG